jgi:eukaryotic-like serine/threonine-protein kinase
MSNGPGTGTSVCPRCGAELKASTLGGLCPRCLVRRARSVPAEAPDVAEVVGMGERVFGPYRLLGELGRGGAGVVYRALDPGLGRDVALKVLLAGEWASRAFVERFRTEATAAAALTHPNIVPVHGFGEIEGRHYLVMRLVPGGTLAEALGQPGLVFTPERAAQLVGKLARAVHHAHQRGILHRDLKPANVLLDEVGEPLLVDFGLAKLVAREGPITQTRAVLGTPAYMSPEQAAGRTEEVTTAADVYGLGAILYELLTGQPPFAGGTTAETVRRVLEEPPRRPTLLRSGLPRDLEVIALKCLEKEPWRRYGSAEALADELERWLRHEPILGRPTPAWERVLRWTRRRPWTAASAALLMAAWVTVGLVIAWSNGRLRAAQEQIAAQAEERRLEVVRLNVVAGDDAWRARDHGLALGHYVTAMTLDGTGGAKATGHRERIQVVMSQMPGLELLSSHGTALRDVAIDEAGVHLATAGADGAVRVWSGVASAQPRVLSHPASVDRVVFNSKGDRLLSVGRDHRVRLWSTGTGEMVSEMRVARAQPTPLETDLRVVRFSPEGRSFVFSATNGLAMHGSQEGGRRWLISGGRRVNDACFSSDGGRLVWADEDGTLGMAEAATGRVLWRTRPGFAIRRVWMSRDGRHVAWANDGFEFCIGDAADGRPYFRPVSHRRLVLDGDFSPDGDRFATASYDNTARVWDVATGRPVMPFLKHDGAVRGVSFTADGHEVMTWSDDGTVRFWGAESGEPLRTRLPHRGPVGAARWLPGSGGGDVVTVSADGGLRRWSWPMEHGALKRWRRGSPVHRLQFHPDGREGLFVWLDGLVNREPLDGDGVRPGAELLPNDARHDAWLSADGRRMLTVDQDFRVKLQDPETGEVLGGPWQIGPMALDAVWTRDGERLVVLEGEKPVVRELSGDRRVSIPSVPRIAGNSIRVSPDGKRVLLVALDLMIHVINLRDGTPVCVPFPMPRGLWTLEWAPDSRRIGFLVEGQVELWDVESGAPTGPKVRLPEPEGRILFTETGDAMILVTEHFLGAIDLRTGKGRFPWKRHAESVVSVAIRPDGQRAATGTADGHAWVWDLNTGEVACPPFLHSGYVMSVAFSPDGTRLLTGDNGGTICLWDVSPSGWSVERLEERVRRWRGEW